MTRKDFIVIADVLKRRYKSELQETNQVSASLLTIIESFEETLAKNNSTFNVTRFRQYIFN